MKLRKKYTRPSATRNPRLIVIASEGTVDEPEYFEELITPDYYYNPRVTIEILKRDSTKSAPRYVVEQLDHVKKTKKLKHDDELWAVIDKDNWSDDELNKVAEHCAANKYHLALSNPCFCRFLPKPATHS